MTSPRLPGVDRLLLPKSTVQIDVRQICDIENVNKTIGEFVCDELLRAQVAHANFQSNLFPHGFSQFPNFFHKKQDHITQSFLVEPTESHDSVDVRLQCGQVSPLG